MNENMNKYFTVKNIIFFIMLILFLIFLGHTIEIAIMFFMAFVGYATLIPIVDKLSEKKYMTRPLATAIVLIVVLGIVLGIFIPLIVYAIKQGVLFVHDIPTKVKELHAFLAGKSFFGYDLSKFISADKIATFLNEYGGRFLEKSVDVTKVIVSLITSTLAISIMVFYFCADRDAIVDGFIKFFPEKIKDKAKYILETITKRVGGFVFAQLVAMVFVGFITMIGLSILGNEHALTLGFVTCVLDIIPAIGPTIATLIGLVAVSTKGVLYIVLTFFVYIIAQLLQNQVLRPIIFGKFMKMHPLTIILSLFIGAKFFGFWGVVLGPALASVVCVLVDELYIKPINKIETGEEKSN